MAWWIRTSAFTSSPDRQWFRCNIDGARRSSILCVWRCSAMCAKFGSNVINSVKSLSPAALHWYCLHVRIAIMRWFIWPWQGIRGYIHVDSQHGPLCDVSEGCLDVAMQVLCVHLSQSMCCSGSNSSGRPSNSSLLSGISPNLMLYNDTIFYPEIA